MILTDIDGVLFDWHRTFRLWVAEILGPPRSAAALNPNHSDPWLQDNYGLSQEQARALVRAFQTSEAQAQMEPFPDAQEYLPKLATEHTIVAITACGDNFATKHFRWANIRRVFGLAIYDVVFVPLDGSKAAALRNYGPAYWIDDHHEHVTSGYECGHYAFHVDRRNRPHPHPDRCHVVTSWAEIYAHITQPQEQAA